MADTNLSGSFKDYLKFVAEVGKIIFKLITRQLNNSSNIEGIKQEEKITEPDPIIAEALKSARDDSCRLNANKRITDFQGEELLTVLNQAMMELTEMEKVSKEINLLNIKITNIAEISNKELRKAGIKLQYKDLSKQKKRLLRFVYVSFFIVTILFCYIFYKNGLFDHKFGGTSDVSSQIQPYIIYVFAGIVILYYLVIMPAIKKSNTNTARTEYKTRLEDEKHKLFIKLDSIIKLEADKIYLIPDKYRYLLAIKMMQEYVANMIESNWSGCAKLYEKLGSK